MLRSVWAIFIVSSILIGLSFGGTPEYDRLQAIQRKVLQAEHEQRQWNRMLMQAGVELGDWYRIGPFRDIPVALNWPKNTASSFAHVYEAEKFLLEGRLPDLEAEYPCGVFPGTPQASRRWQLERDWVDGFLCDLPRGPAPSTGESQYLYRTIDTRAALDIALDFRVRSPEESWWPGWHKYWPQRENHRYRARFKCYLNGVPVQSWEGRTDVPDTATLQLKPGRNHFFAKVTNNRHSYGFSFAIAGLHPKPETSAMDGESSSWFTAYSDSEQPWFREDGSLGPQVRDEQRYQETLLRLRNLRFCMSPMPGIEQGIRGPTGEITTVMEDRLRSVPSSEAGRRYRARLDALEQQVSSLLARIVRDDKPYCQSVLRMGRVLEAHWQETIETLPEILFLERPRYSHDSMQYTQNGKTPSAIRAFNPQKKAVRTLYHRATLKAHDINLSWDAQTVFIGGGGQVQCVGVDGNDYHVLTSGQSPAEMPDGRIVFFDDSPGTSPCKSGAPRRLLFSVDPKGENRTLLSANLTIDNHPQILNDGRVVFARWDYGVNKDVFSRHGIWTQNPDGTSIDLYFGNTIIDPFGFYRMRQIPGRPEMVCILGTHHTSNNGLVGLVWNGLGQEAGDGCGFQRVTPDAASVADDHYHMAGFQDPYPLNEQLFLVSYAGDKDHKTGIYLLDRYGNRKCLFEPAQDLAAVCPQPLIARPRPPVTVDRTDVTAWTACDPKARLLSDPDWTQKGTLFLQDVYQGIAPEIKRGQAAYLAVMEQIPETRGRGGAMGLGAIFYVNRCIGLVPIEADGSAYFEVPALRSLYFHVLDKDGKMLMTQGSDFHVMPGEQRSCIGCHEQRQTLESPMNHPARKALRKRPRKPAMPDWGTQGILAYEEVVQPVWDRHCVSCHSGETPEGRLDLSGDRTTIFNLSYLELVEKGLLSFTPGAGRTYWQNNLDYDQQAPLSRGSVLSRLVQIMDDSQHGHQSLPLADKLRVFLWIDSNIPFYGHYDQSAPAVLSSDARKTLKAVYKRRCADCHSRPDRRDAINFLKADHITVHTGERPGQWGVTESGMRVRHLNLSRPERSAALQAPLSKTAGGWGLCKDMHGRPVFADHNDPDFQHMLDTLTAGIIERDEPGILALLELNKENR